MYYTQIMHEELKILTEQTVDIRVQLEGDHATKFGAIKKFKGVTQNTEVFRAIITDFFKENEETLSKFITTPCKEL